MHMQFLTARFESYRKKEKKLKKKIFTAILFIFMAIFVFEFTFEEQEKKNTINCFTLVRNKERHFL